MNITELLTKIDQRFDELENKNQLAYETLTNLINAYNKQRQQEHEETLQMLGKILTICEDAKSYLMDNLSSTAKEFGIGTAECLLGNLIGIAIIGVINGFLVRKSQRGK